MTSDFVTWINNRRPLHPLRFTLSTDFWAEAVLLAAARLQSNDGKREQKRDRQTENPRVDLMGAASELLLYRSLQRYAHEQSTIILSNQLTEVVAQRRDGANDGLNYMRDQLFVLGGGAVAANADMKLMDEVGEKYMDAKSFDFAKNKSRFAINEEKHRKLERLQTDYFCLLCPPLAKRALVAIVPYSDVTSWKSEILGARIPPDPAKTIDINQFMKKYLKQSFHDCELLTSSCHPLSEVNISYGIDGRGRLRIADSAPLIFEILTTKPHALDAVLDRFCNF